MHQVLLVLIHVALQDFLERTQQSLEGVSVNGNHPTVGHCLDAGLPHCVLDQGNLSEVVTFLVLEHLPDLGRRTLPLLGDQLAFCDDVETISLFPLFDYIAAWLEFFLFQGVAELFFLVGVHFCQDFYFRKDAGIVFAFFGGCLLNDVVKSRPVQAIEEAGSFGTDRGSPRSVVHQGQFPEKLAGVVGLQVGLGAVDDFEAVELSLSDDVQSAALFSFYDDVLVGRGADFLHGVDDDSDIFLVEAAEEDAFFDESLDDLFGAG